MTLGAGLPGRHRRRGALRRPRPFRAQADPDRLVRSGAAVAAAQLFRSGRQGARRSYGDREPVLPAGARALCCCRWSCSRLRRLSIASQAVITGAYSLVHQAIQLGLSAAACDPAHLGVAGRTDLHSARHRGPAGRASCCWSACSAARARSPPPTASRSPPRWWWMEFWPSS